MGKREVRTVELTAKKWKVLILVGDILFYGAITLMVAAVVALEVLALAVPDRWGMVVVIIFIVAGPLGALCMVIGRIGRWWYHA